MHKLEGYFDFLLIEYVCNKQKEVWRDLTNYFKS